MNTPLIDIHTHLSAEEFDGDRSEVLTRALEVCDVLIDIGSGTSHEAFLRAKNLAESHPQVYFTAGIHPHDADKIGSDDSVLNQIEELLSHPKCVAIGECGLDYFYKNSSRDNQMKTFEWHIKKAEEFALPLMIHTRDAEKDTKDLLARYEGPAVFHCFTGTEDLALFGVAKDFLVSFSGIVTFKKAEDLRAIFLKLPLKNIVVETDSPFLAPVPMRGKRNESAFVKHTAEFLAHLAGLPFEEFAKQTSENAFRVFSKMQRPPKP